MLDSSPPLCVLGHSPVVGAGTLSGERACQDPIVTLESVPTPSVEAASTVGDWHPEAVPDEFGGYRIVRLVSHSERATTALVRSGDETRVARVFAARCSAATIDAELAVHDAVASSDAALREHVAGLHDLVTLPGGRLAIILTFAAGPSLSDVLAARHGRLALGEAVTIVAPLAEARDAAHAVGLTGLSFAPSAVRFTAAGAPIVVRLSDTIAGPVLPDRFRATEPAYVDDRERFERLLAAVVAAVTPADRPSLTAAMAPRGTGASLATALFDLASPMPVLLHPEARERVFDDTEPGEVLSSSPSPPAPSAPTVNEPAVNEPAERGATPGWLAATLDALGTLGLPSTIRSTVETFARTALRRLEVLVAGVAGLVARTGLARGGVARPRFVVAGAAGLAALVAAVLIVAAPPGGDEPVSASDSDTAGVSTTAPSVSVNGEALTPASASSAGGMSEGGESGVAAIDSPETLRDPGAEDWPVVVSELVSRWISCRAEIGQEEAGTSPLCAADVAHRGSAAELLLGEDDPRHARLEQWKDALGESVVVERMGGAAVIDLVMRAESTDADQPAASTTAASLLVVRSEAGWRIRSVLSDEPRD
ncbi:MAG: hypothetical protein RLZZ608_940 [Actinomycetota bacterium]